MGYSINTIHVSCNSSSSQSCHISTNCNFSDFMIASICYIYITLYIHSHIIRVVKLSHSINTIHVSCNSSPSQSCHISTRCDFSDFMIASICYINITCSISGDTIRVIKLSHSINTIQTSTHHRACEGTHYSIGSNLANCMIAKISHIDIPLSIHSHFMRTIKRC